MASLFGKNKLRDIATKLQTSDLEDKIALVKTWHNDYHNGSLKLDKETSREQAYNQDFFIKILGYKEKPAVPYSFEPKATTDKGQLPDAVLSHTDVAQDLKNIAAVVELKGASIELDRPQRREGNMSPVQQGFKYKTQYRNCPFVVVSNFWEFRLYHDNQLDYELWTLDDLVDPEDDYLKFKTFYTLLHSDNLTTPKGASKTEGWLSDIRFEQEEIGKKFYKVYREARTDLLRDIYRHNENVRTDIDMGIEKAQKIIDRIVFACFAEDRGLLPDDTLRRVIQAADNSTFGGSLWSTFKGFFEAIDTGSEKLEIPDGYNGGLFAHDPELNALKVSDEPLRKIASISNYNFVEDLSVTILGHIFEQSISDLEEIKSKVEETQSLDSIQQSRRKKDGIFYTPDYIVRYIVDNSLGAYLREEEERLKNEFKLKGDITDKNYEKRERQAYGKYQEFLQNVKVVDPACGSGAFLVYVFDYLLAENKRVASILGNSLFSSDDYIKSILQNNIYGVDLNDESVEITKLSLWLKSAQKGKKLTTLDGNIKSGNSLIDDPEIAGDKAFNWQEQFSEIFKNGGFDVVVGNPPYGASVSSADKSYLERKFKTYEYQLNSYSLFYECGLGLLKEGGLLGFITPATFTYQKYFNKLRSFMQDYTQVSIVKYVYEVFQDADIGDAVSWVIKKQKNTKLPITVRICRTTQDQDVVAVPKNYNQVVDDDGYYNLAEQTVQIKVATKLLGGIANITAGIKPYQVGKGTPKQTREIVTNKIFTSDRKIDETYVQCIIGKDFHRYRFINEPKMFLSYGKWLAEPRESAPFFDSEKIVVRQTADSLICTLDDKKRINLNNVYNIGADDNGFNLKYILGLLNSRFLNYLYQGISQEKGRTFAEVKKNYLEKLPIPIVNPAEQITLIQLSDSMLKVCADKQSLETHFKNLIQEEFNIEKWPIKLNEWWVFSFSDFVKTLKVNLTLTQKDELLQLFEKYKNKCTELDNKIQKTDQEIDGLVYKLYNLSPQEVAIVEKS